jgi:RNA polymerase sigma-70 factor (ECF subfamily)
VNFGRQRQFYKWQRNPFGKKSMPDPSRYSEFVYLLQRATGQIFAYLNALLLNWNDAEDVFQDACVVLWEKFDEFRPGSNFVAWALRVAQHKAMDFQKSRARRSVFWKAELQDSLMAAMAEADATDEGLAALSGCVARLDEADRNLIQRCYGDGVPVRQIAAQLGRSPQSVHNSLRRIRGMLLDCIERVTRQEDRR